MPRYGDRMDQKFMYTVTHGRPEKGMPDWTGAFDNDQFTKILVV
jgi:polar amino acid transport system substrate-binding protein